LLYLTRDKSSGRSRKSGSDELCEHVDDMCESRSEEIRVEGWSLGRDQAAYVDHLLLLCLGGYPSLHECIRGS